MATSSFEKVIYEKRGRIAIVTINRPEVMNAIDPQTSAELHEAWCDFRDDEELWVVDGSVVTSPTPIVSQQGGRSQAESLPSFVRFITIC